MAGAAAGLAAGVAAGLTAGAAAGLTAGCAPLAAMTHLLLSGWELAVSEIGRPKAPNATCGIWLSVSISRVGAHAMHELSVASSMQAAYFSQLAPVTWSPMHASKVAAHPAAHGATTARQPTIQSILFSGSL